MHRKPHKRSTPNAYASHTIFQAGANAAERNCSMFANPHVPGSREAALWSSGYWHKKNPRAVVLLLAQQEADWLRHHRAPLPHATQGA